MQFRYPARLQPDLSDEITVSLRDFPECLTSGADESAALVEARDALEEAVAGRIDDDEPIPVPSRRRAGEQYIAVPPDMAAKAAFAFAYRDSGLSRLASARRLGVNEKVVRRLLDPRTPHRSQPHSQGPTVARTGTDRGVPCGAKCVSGGSVNGPVSDFL